MNHPDGRRGFIDFLTSGTTRTTCHDFEILISDDDLNRIYFWEHSNRYSTRMNTSFIFRLWNTLNSMNSGFIFKPRISTKSSNLHNTFFDTTTVIF
jgi:hypothetical protein